MSLRWPLKFPNPLSRSIGPMVTRIEVRCPRRGSDLRSHNAVPPSLHGVREGPFPRFDATMGPCDSLTSISPRFVSFAGRYHRGVPCSSPSAQDTAVDQPGVGKPVLRPAITMEAAGSPKFPGNPRDHSPCSSDPGETRQAEWAMSKLPGAVPASDNNEDSPRG